MNKKDFERILSKFVDNPNDIDSDKGNYIFSIDGELVDVKLEKTDSGGLNCIENSISMPVKKWIALRLGKLDILARAILEKIQPDEHIVPTPVQIQDNKDKSIKYNNCLDVLTKKIEEQSNFSTNLIYITSEAGEGKTMIMNELARKQADLYCTNNTDWLFVPIALSGRPFLRLDEIIIGTLANFYRFRSYYIESFIELIKLDFIVLGLDGFEEMSIEGASGDVISSLGNLLNGLDSEGTLLFAARKAYYNYSNLHSQAKLLDSFKDNDVSFSELQIIGWDEEQFIKLLITFGYNEKEAKSIYKRLSAELTNSHPILSRAVLARKLAEEIFESKGDNLDQIIHKFKNGEKNQIFSKFITLLLEREIKKWVKKDELTEELLSIKEHMHLLESIAEEMWTTNSEKLKKNTLVYLTELECDSLNKNPTTINQCKSRILDHAFITENQDGLFSFCHEDFYLFFLGQHIAKTLINYESKFTLRRLMDKKIFPQLAIQECCRFIIDNEKQFEVINTLQSFSKQVIRTSCFSQNISSIILPLSEKYDKQLILNGLYCSSNALSNIILSNLIFENCLIEKIEFSDKLIKDIIFRSCEINELVYFSDSKISNISFDATSLPKILIENNDNSIYDPTSIAIKLNNNKIEIRNHEENSNCNIIIEDESINLFFKIIHIFQRTTAINENVLKTKFNSKWANFDKDVLTPIIDRNIIKLIDYKGSGKQRRFKLNISFQILNDARRDCKGDFQKFLNILEKNTL